MAVASRRVSQSTPRKSGQSRAAFWRDVTHECGGATVSSSCLGLSLIAPPSLTAHRTVYAYAPRRIASLTSTPCARASTPCAVLPHTHQTAHSVRVAYITHTVLPPLAVFCRRLGAAVVGLGAAASLAMGAPAVASELEILQTPAPASFKGYIVDDGQLLSRAASGSLNNSLKVRTATYCPRCQPLHFKPSFFQSKPSFRVVDHPEGPRVIGRGSD